jgi:anti-sigma B factor antagonist
MYDMCDMYDDEIRNRTRHCVRERVVGGATVVELHGEIDLLTAPHVSKRMDALTKDPRPELVLDLRGVTFIDCRGLSVLCRARNRALSRGGRVRLVVGNRRMLRLLRLTLLSEAFDVYPTLGDALPRTAEPVEPAGLDYAGTAAR